MKAVRNQALVFNCQASELVGILTLPAALSGPLATVVIALPAGGPQYRVGMGRQLRQLGNYLGERGIGVFRFDYRGIGDSSGEFLGFQSVADDLKCAIAAVKAELPEIKHVVLWGGCNAASAIMIHAWKFPEVTGMVVSNPFLGDHKPGSRAMRSHYLSRVREREFWAKLFSGRYNVSAYTRSLATHIKARFRKPQVASPLEHTPTESKAGREQEASVLNEMLEGMNRFQGRCLFFLSGRSLQSREFQSLLSNSKAWKLVAKKLAIAQKILPDADQAFSAHDRHTAQWKGGGFPVIHGIAGR